MGVGLFELATLWLGGVGLLSLVGVWPSGYVLARMARAGHFGWAGLVWLIAVSF